MGNIEVIKLVFNLGVLMDSTLSWEPQINSIVNGIKVVWYRRKRMSAYTDTVTQAKLISTLVFPLLDYCAAIYSDQPGTLNSKLQTALNSCVTHVYGLG